MSIVDRIICHFDGPDGRGGLTAFSRAMAHGNPTTVQGWRERGAVPRKQIPKVIKVCARRGLELDHAAFFADAPAACAV